MAEGGAAMTRFERPRSVAEAASLLATGDWALLAGGTDLYPAHVGRPIARPLLDLSQVEGLRGIRRTESGWTIGATTTWSDVIRADLSPLFDALKAAAREVGGLQIQNAGTVAGNVCNASPAADGMPALLALGAEVELQSASGSRQLPLAAFVLGSRRTARRDDELVSALHVPARAATARSVFLKLGGRRYLVISLTMIAVVIELDAAGAVTHAGVAVGSCSAVAQRLPALEARLLGRHADALSACVAPGDLAPLTPIDDIRASGEFRRDATLTLLRRAWRASRHDRTRPRSAADRASPCQRPRARAGRRPVAAALGCAARRARPHRHQDRLPRRRLRRLHGAGRAEQVCACLVAVGQCEGKAVTTVEGLADAGGALSPLQRAFVAHGRRSAASARRAC